MAVLQIALLSRRGPSVLGSSTRQQVSGFWVRHWVSEYATESLRPRCGRNPTGIEIKRMHSIHSATNLLPSVTLDNATPSRLLMRLFGILAFVEESVSSWPIVRRLGCSLVIAGNKR
jgi:hypothetical protein